MAEKLAKVVKFTIVMMVTLPVCVIVWQLVVNEKLYDCTASVGFDYLLPGDWVHGRVQVVREIKHRRSMSGPDTIKEGWSIAGLWGLWFTFFTCSVVVSGLLARLQWLPPCRTD